MLDINYFADSRLYYYLSFSSTLCKSLRRCAVVPVFKLVERHASIRYLPMFHDSKFKALDYLDETRVIFFSFMEGLSFFHKRVTFVFWTSAIYLSLNKAYLFFHGRWSCSCL